jgi:hypothetical protein
MQTAFIPKRPIGPFRGSVLGFLGGVCAVSAFGFYTLFDKVIFGQFPISGRRADGSFSQYTTASALLLQSVEDLKRSSLELQNYTERLEKVEERCKRLEARSATREEAARIERDTRALYVSAKRTVLARVLIYVSWSPGGIEAVIDGCQEGSLGIGRTH